MMAPKIGLKLSLVNTRTLTRKQTRKNTGSLILLQFAGSLGHYRKTLRQPLQSSMSSWSCFDREARGNCNFLLACLILPSMIFNRFVLRCFATKCKSCRRGIDWVKFQISQWEVHGGKLYSDQDLCFSASSWYLSWSYHGKAPAILEDYKAL